MKIENRKKLGDVLKEYKEKNTDNKYKPVAVGRYGIRKREDIYSKELAKDYSKNKLIYKNTLTVGMGSKQIDIGILTEDEIYAVSPAYHTFRINNIDANYLRYCLDARNADMSERFMIASARQGKSVDFKKMLEYEIPVYSERDTQTILFNLSKIEDVILNLDSQLEKMDLLVKSRFVEMFGDPRINEKGYVKADMGDYMTLLTDFSSNGSYQTLDSGVTMYDEPNYAWMVRTTDLESGDMSSIKYIDESAYELLGKSKIYGGEIIMSKIGSAGKVYLMPEIDMPASLGRNAFMFRFDERVNVRFLYEQLLSEYGQAEIQQYVRGAVTKTITKEAARSIRVIMPDKELQDEFVNYVKVVDKSKLAIYKIKKHVLGRRLAT